MANRKTRPKYNPKTAKLPGTNLALLARAIQLIARREARVQQQAESQPCGGLTFTNSNNLWPQSGTTSTASSTTSKETPSFKSSSPSDTTNTTNSRSSSVQPPSHHKKRKTPPSTSIYQQEVARKKRERLLRISPQNSLDTTPATTPPPSSSPSSTSQTDNKYDMERWVATEARSARIGSKERHDTYHGTTSPTTDIDLPNLHSKRKISSVDDEPSPPPQSRTNEPSLPPSKKRKTNGRTSIAIQCKTRPRINKSFGEFLVTEEDIDAEKVDCHFCQLEALSTHTDYPVTVVNEMKDGATFPKDFRFIEKSILGTGVERVKPEFRSGCNCDSARGCLTDKCECHNPDSDIIVPYHATGPEKGRLKRKLFNSPLAIFECNEACVNCKNGCPKRVVDNGRKWPLTIFRTDNGRGWGVRCPVFIPAGSFIDKYIGEILTSKSANHRRKNADRSQHKDIYLFALDKFKDEETHGPKSDLYEVDGEFFGGPTRFINHSCEPNCRIFARVGDEADKHLHDLAFFAIKDIEPNEEITFDYVDNQHEEAKFDGLSEEEVEALQAEMTRCLCPSKKCRGWLW